MSREAFVREKLSGRNTPKQQAALLALIEECGEVAHAAAKALRFGLGSHHPDVPWENNLEQISRELGDVGEAYNRLVAAKPQRQKRATPLKGENSERDHRRDANESDAPLGAPLPEDRDDSRGAA